MAIQIKKAVRQRVWLKIAVTGPTGAGKTWGAISVAKGMAPTGKVLVIDTENDSASLYADRWDFDTITIHAPFTTQKYSEALDAAIENNYEVVVIDSLTHEWAASGGLLDQKAAKDARGGNSFTNWNEMKRLHNGFVERLLQAPIHVVGTLRSKMAYAQEQDERGKTTIRKVGLAPITSDDLEYEFSIVFDVERNTHMAIASKDRTSLFEGRSLNMGETVGKELATWLAGGAALPTPEAAPRPTPTAPDASATPAESGTEKPEPKSVGEAILQMPAPEPTAVSQAANDFVEGIDPTPKEEPHPAFITQGQWEEVAEWTKKAPDLSRQLKAYSVTKGWLKPNAQGLNTLLASCWVQLSNQIQNRSEAFIAHLNSHFPAQAAPAAEPTTPTKTRRTKAA